MPSQFDFINYGTVGTYQDAVRRGRCFTAGNTAAQALSLNSATATGLILSNPVTSGVNMVILRLKMALTTAPAGAATLIWTGTLLTTAEAATTHTTPLVVKNAHIGSNYSAAACKADSAATVPAPTIIAAIGGGPVAGSSINTPVIDENVGGSLWLAPGCVISIQCLTTAISAVTTAWWEEVPTS